MTHSPSYSAYETKPVHSTIFGLGLGPLPLVRLQPLPSSSIWLITLLF